MVLFSNSKGLFGVCAGDGAVPVPLPLYLLGLDIQERWTFAVDITAARDLFMVRSMWASWAVQSYLGQQQHKCTHNSARPYGSVLQQNPASPICMQAQQDIDKLKVVVNA